MSYAQVTKNEAVVQRGGEENHERRQNMKKEQQLVRSQEELGMAWANSVFTGWIRNEEDTPMIQQRMIDEGIVTMKVIPIGGGKMFLKPNEDEYFNALVKESAEVFKQWFNTIREWDPRHVGRAQYIWCRIFGVLIHAWRNKVFSRRGVGN